MSANIIATVNNVSLAATIWTEAIPTPHAFFSSDYVIQKMKHFRKMEYI